mgnify:FL=1
MKIGIVALHWPPNYGGAERYNSRLVDELNNKGIEAWGITPTAADENMDNGTEYVHRISTEKATALNDSLGMTKWLLDAYDHVEENGYTHIIISNCRIAGHPYGDFMKRLRAIGVKVGVLHFDLDKRIRVYFEELYAQHGDWEIVAEKMMSYIKGCFTYDTPLWDDKLGYWAIDSPLLFSPDFVISCSEWEKKFIDPFNTTPSFVLHPFLPKVQINKEELVKVDITMLNPMYHKGRSYMADIVNDYSNKWLYRVLLGGYGGDKDDFMNMIADSWAIRDGRIDILPYVERMEDVWDSTKLFIFPSRFEGYGMAAVEPMAHGVPVMVQNYPSVIEAVGDAAIIMPYGEDSREWVETIEELFFDDEEYEELQRKGYERVQHLKEREDEEIEGLITFMEKLL